MDFLIILNSRLAYDPNLVPFGIYIHKNATKAIAQYNVYEVQVTIPKAIGNVR